MGYAVGLLGWSRCLKLRSLLREKEAGWGVVSSPVGEEGQNLSYEGKGDSAWLCHALRREEHCPSDLLTPPQLPTYTNMSSTCTHPRWAFSDWGRREAPSK